MISQGASHTPAPARPIKSSMPEIVIVDTPDEGGALLADAFISLHARKPDAVLGLATGSTPLPAYRALAERARELKLDLSRVTGFALDEYVGLPSGHPQSYRTMIDEEVVAPLGLDPARIHVPSGALGRIHLASEEYERAIEEAGGIDLQILGIGTVGHIGFNEPGSSLTSLTRVKTLAHQTRVDNSRFFGSLDEVPTHAITQGLGTILRAQHLVLLAFGEGKARAIAAAVEGPLTSSEPASVIQLHPHCTVIVDEAAASQLQNTDYYRHAWANKLEWQQL